VVALRLGRKAIGIDASADCLEFTKKRILEVGDSPQLLDKPRSIMP